MGTLHDENLTDFNVIDDNFSKLRLLLKSGEINTLSVFVFIRNKYRMFSITQVQHFNTCIII